MPKQATDLTPKYLDGLKPKAGQQYEKFDGAVAGLLIRVTATGGKTWGFKFRMADGGYARMVLGAYPVLSLAEARQKARDAQKRVADGKDPRVSDAPQAILTVSDLIDLRAARQLRHSAKQYVRTCLDIERDYDSNVIPAACVSDPRWSTIGVVPVGEFKVKHLNDVLNPIKDRGAFVQAERTFINVQALFNFAVKQGLLEYNPIAKAERPKAEGAVEEEARVLSIEEIRFVWEALDVCMQKSDDVPRILRIMLATGQRVSEVAGALRSELHLTENRPYWRVGGERVKNKMGDHIVPLNTIAVELFRDAIKAAGDRDILFPGRKGLPIRGTAVARTLQRAHERGEFGKMAAWTSHDLRRTVSDLPSVRAHGLELADKYMDHVLNHKSATKGSVRQRHYNPHDFFDEKADALDEWGAFLAKLIEGGNVLKIAA